MTRTFIAYTDHSSARFAPRRYVIDVDAFGYTEEHTALVADTMRKATAITSDVRVIVLDEEPTVALVKTLYTGYIDGSPVVEGSNRETMRETVLRRLGASVASGELTEAEAHGAQLFIQRYGDMPTNFRSVVDGGLDEYACGTLLYMGDPADMAPYVVATLGPIVVATA